jgi:opacity protein-like surface antigen
MRQRRGRAIAMVTGIFLLTASGDTSGQTLEDYDYTNLGFRAFGAEATWVNATQSESTFGVGIRVDLGFLGPYIRIVPRAAWWSANVTDSINLGSLERTAWILGADVQWTLQDAVFAPYLGVGLEVYLLDNDGDAINGTFLDNMVITAGISGLIGAELNLADHWRVYSELRGTLVTDASNAAVALGLAYRL